MLFSLPVWQVDYEARRIELQELLSVCYKLLYKSAICSVVIIIITIWMFNAHYFFMGALCFLFAYLANAQTAASYVQQQRICRLLLYVELKLEQQRADRKNGVYDD